MKPLTLIVAVFVSLVLLSSVRGEVSLDAPPPGIHAKDWIPITSTLGFVIIDDRSESPHTLTPGHRPVRGYFMALRKDAWRRLEVASEMRLHRIDEAR
jgi:hypothetical protein